ncbi:MAG TPA: hypothetical protein VJK54_04920 [Chthoniobacterales bacterium]|nr:hypothetical protein [Chthoniobacterales bacterium]
MLRIAASRWCSEYRVCYIHSTPVRHRLLALHQHQRVWKEVFLLFLHFNLKTGIEMDKMA